MSVISITSSVPKFSGDFLDDDWSLMSDSSADSEIDQFFPSGPYESCYDVYGNGLSSVWRFWADDIEGAYETFLLMDKQRDIRFVYFGRAYGSANVISGMVGFSRCRSKTYVKNYMACSKLECIMNYDDDNFHTETLDTMYAPVTYAVRGFDKKSLYVTLDAHEDDTNTDEEMDELVCNMPLCNPPFRDEDQEFEDDISEVEIPTEIVAPSASA